MTNLETLLMLLGAGSLAGFVAGFFGVGGGIILVPILLYYYNSVLSVSSVVSTHLAMGTSLLIVVATSVFSAASHYRNGHVLPRAALTIGLVSVVAAFCGSLAAGVLSGRVLQQVFSGVLLLAAGQLLLNRQRKDQKERPSYSMPMLALTGLATGSVSSLTGVGGGIVSIPMMHSVLGFPMKKAIGTSSATIVLTAAAAAIGYVVSGLSDPALNPYLRFTLGYIDYIHSLPLVLGTLPFAVLGASVAHRVRSPVLSKLFGVLMLVVAVKMFFG